MGVGRRGLTEGVAAERGDGVSTALRSSSGGADKPHVLAPDFEAHFRYDWNEPGPGDWSHWRVRRLMPVECERSEEHTSETPVTNAHLVFRLLLEKKQKKIINDKDQKKNRRPD